MHRALPILLLLAAGIQAQTGANVALHHPYRLNQAPPATTSGADNTGAETFRENALFRGELTDGKTTAQSKAHVVGWQIRYTPISVDIDLERTVVIDTLSLAPIVRLQQGGAQQVNRIDISVRTPQFPYDTWVQIAQWRPENVTASPQPLQIALPPTAATHIRVSFIGKAWAGLYLDEIAVLETSRPPQKLLPCQDFTIEAEACVKASAIEAKGASGQAVPLKANASPIRLTLPLPQGIYTVRIRSQALKQDTFSEILPHADGVPMRPQPVTNGIFTWQRSHFTHATDGQAEITLALGEGEGVLVDQIRIHRTNLDQTITRLKTFPKDTLLTRNGIARCLIAAGDGGGFQDIADKLAAEIEKRCGVRIPVRAAEDITELDLRSSHILVLGARTTNIVLLKARGGGWGIIPTPPAGGAPLVYVAVGVRGTGTNMVLLGGNDEAQINASIAAFLERLQSTPEPRLPWTRIPAPRIDKRKDFRSRAIASGKWLRQGAIRTILKNAKYHDDASFSMLMHRYWEYLDSADTIRRASYHGALDMEFHKILPNFEHREHNPAFSEADHLALTNLMMRLTDLTAGLFTKWWGLRGPDGDAGISQRIRERPPRITWNHQTFPALCLGYGADYFGRHYGLESARVRRGWVEALMQTPFVSSKPMCDCWGYQDITIAHTAYLASLLGRWDYYEQLPLHRFLRLRYMVHDNLNAPVGYGDVGGYGGPVAGDPRDGMPYLTKVTGGHIDLRRTAPEDVEALYIHPLEPLWYSVYGASSRTPLGAAFDKISMRQNHDPDRAYLLLDGLSGSSHGHWDGNSILRFTDNGRMWLCEGDYLKGSAKDHNTLTIMRDTKSEFPDKIVELRTAVATEEWVLTVTRTPRYAGTDWDRHILWHRPSDTFLLLDAVTARKAGMYDATVRFRSLGRTQLRGRVWQVEQAGDQRFYIHAPGAGRLTTAEVPEEAKNWQRYEYAGPIPKLFRHRLTSQMKSGESLVIPNVFYAAGANADPRLEVFALGGAGLTTSGALNVAAIAGPARIAGVSVEAIHVLLADEMCLLAGLTRLEAPSLTLSAPSPVTLAIDLAKRTATTSSRLPTTLVVQCGQKQTRHRISGGEGTLENLSPELVAALAALRTTLSAHAQNTSPANSAPVAPENNAVELAHISLPADSACLALANIGSPPTLHALVGCEDGTLLALSQNGKTLWTAHFNGRVNALAAGDLDGDGRDEIACAVEDSQLHVLNADGSERWTKFFEAFRSSGGIEGHPRVTLFADFDADGTPEIAVGCASSIFYVLNADGTPKTGKTGAWQATTQHKACGIGAADMTGDGQLELLCGFTYASRRIIDFSRSGYDRISSISGCHGGSRAITTADFDLDGKAEAVFADVDGRVTVTKPYAKKRLTAVKLWSAFVGDEAHARALADDVVGDQRPELALASASGFLALLDADGEVLWTRYATDAVTDAALLAGSDRKPVLLRAARDGTVTAFDGTGKRLANWRGNNAILRLAAHRAPDRDLVWALQKRTLSLLHIPAVP
ncbi:MAG: VCBS repeat-containing protein [Lentisphaeria bacterium]|nr:VCBS repeat-containing protein [Lentisphaeria bacterium]